MDVDTLTQAVKSCHKSVQKQALVKLSHKIESFVENNGELISKSKVCQDFNILLDHVGSEVHYVGFLSAKLILYLVKKNAVSLSFTLTACVSQSALNKPRKNLLQLVFSLLLETSVVERLQAAQNPIIRMYLNLQQSSSEMFTEVHEFLLSCMQKDLLHNTRSFMAAIDMFKPFIKNVISNGKHSVELVTELLECLSFAVYKFSKSAREMFAFIKDCACSQSVLNAMSAMSTIQKLAVWYIEHRGLLTDDANMIIDMVSSVLTCCWNLIDNDVYSKLHFGFHLLNELLCDEFLISSCARDLEEDIIFVCSMMLLKVDEEIATKILHLLLRIVPKYVHMTKNLRTKNILTVVMFPSLQILSDKTTDMLQSDAYELAENIVENIDVILNLEADESKVALNHFSQLNTHSEIMNVARCSLSLLQSLYSSEVTVAAWLADVREMYRHKSNVVIRENNTLTLAAILVNNKHSDVFADALATISVVCKHHSILVPSFISLLLHCLESKKYAQVKLDILYTFPKLATDKYVISSVLKTILSVSSCNDLLPVSIKLMKNLWKEQSRVFPYLHQLLSKQLNKTSTSVKLWCELTLAKVSTILEICLLKASQHGKDMVPMLSNILEELIEKTSEDEDIVEQMAASLALLIEALKTLCEEQVISIQSIWKAVVLKVQRKNHPVILQSLTSLLSIVPSCVPETKEEFYKEVLHYLWFLVNSQNLDVVSSAYTALSKFPASLQKVKFLPLEVRDNVTEKLEASKEHKDDEEYDADDDVCPGFAYLMLLQKLPRGAMLGFKTFLQSVLQSEIDSQPRGVGRRAAMKPTTSIHGSTPEVLLQLYESSTRPGVLPGLAAGLLHCYEPKLYGMDQDNPTKKQVKQISDRYIQMLDSLLQDFKIQANDWHHIISAPKAWCYFMKQLFHCVIEGRKADLQLQKERGLVTDEEIYNDDLKSVKFWSRDQITNQLRKSSKGSPKIQGNSILAFAGLANAVASHEENESKIEKMHTPDQYISVRSWLLKVADTVMVIFDGNYKPKSKPFQWCQQVSSEKSTASSSVSRCCAAIALSELIAPLLSLDTERITQMIEALKERCPGQSKAGSSAPLQFYCSLAFGMLLSRLYQEQFLEIIGNDGSSIMLACLSVLQNIVFQGDTVQQDGAIVAYGLAISSLICHDSRKDSKVHGLACQGKLLNKCRSLNGEDVSTITGQAFCFALACVTFSAFHTEGIAVHDVQACFELLEQQISHDSQFSDFHHSLGLLCHTLIMSKRQDVQPIVEKQLEEWQSILTTKESNTMKKLGAVKGIMSTVGIEIPLFKIEDTSDVSNSQTIKNLLKLLLKVLQTSQDNLLCLITAHLIGRSHMSISSVQDDNSNLPQNYNYLKNTSLLLVVFNSLLKASSSGPHGEFNDDMLTCMLLVLGDLRQCQLPPVNWTLVLSPLLRIGYSNDVKFHCIKFAMKFADSSSNLALLVSSWLQANVFLKMKESLQMEIFENTTQLLSCLTNAKQRCLLEELPLKALTASCDVESMMACVLKSWLSVLKMQSPLQSTIAYIMAAMKTFLDSIVSQLEKSAIFSNMDLLAKCIYTLLQRNWKNVIPQLSSAPEIKHSLQIHMLRHLHIVNTDDVMLLLSAKDSSDKQVCLPNIVLYKTLCELHKEASIKECLSNILLTLVKCSKTKDLSKEESNLFRVCVALLSSTGWCVTPVTLLSDDTSCNLLFHILRRLSPFETVSMVSTQDYRKALKISND